MRDILVTLIVFGGLPFILARPAVGILMWSWLSYMNPHRLGWGFAYNFPFNQLVALALFVSLLFTREPRRFPVTPLTVVWLLFIIWMSLTTYNAFYPETAQEQLTKVFKIQLITFLTLLVMYTKERIHLLIWVIVISIGFFGVKGGIFTILTGGSYRVWGPPGSAIYDNNELALALLMIIPLINYLRLQSTHRLLRWALLASMLLCTASVLGTYSRGAIIAGTALTVFFWLKSNKKFITGIMLIIIVPTVVLFMPQSWQDRIKTMTQGGSSDITEVSENIEIPEPILERDRLGWWPNDASALGRVNAWNYAINVANDNLFGAGFFSWKPGSFSIYAPLPQEVHAAHSIYFSVLGDHGWIGLFLFVLILVMTWFAGSWVIRHAKAHAELKSMVDLARMIQVSRVAYASGGAFLSLSYFDFYWHLVAIMVLTKLVVKKQLQSIAQESSEKQKQPVRRRFSSGTPQTA